MSNDNHNPENSRTRARRAFMKTISGSAALMLFGSNAIGQSFIDSTGGPLSARSMMVCTSRSWTCTKTLQQEEILVVEEEVVAGTNGTTSYTSSCNSTTAINSATYSGVTTGTAGTTTSVTWICTITQSATTAGKGIVTRTYNTFGERTVTITKTSQTCSWTQNYAVAPQQEFENQQHVEVDGWVIREVDFWIDDPTGSKLSTRRSLPDMWQS